MVPGTSFGQVGSQVAAGRLLFCSHLQAVALLLRSPPTGKAMQGDVPRVDSHDCMGGQMLDGWAWK